MSTPDFPLHPESVPPRIAYSPGHRQWLDEMRAKRRRKAVLASSWKSLMDYKVWWNIAKFMYFPLIGATIMALFLSDRVPSTVATVAVLRYEVTLLAVVSCGLTGFCAYIWQEAKKTRDDWAAFVILGTINGAIIAFVGFALNALSA